jgi:hypothetical protein
MQVMKSPSIETIFLELYEFMNHMSSQVNAA